MAVELALRNGNPDAVRDQLGADAAVQQQFDLALLVQEARGDAPDTDRKRRLSMRTEDAAEKRRAERQAAALIADEEKAALFTAADTDADTLPLLSPLELDNLPEAERLIDGFLVKESLVRLYGPPKSFKSFVMLDMAACVGAGIRWCNRETTPAKVLYVVAEGVRGIRRRVRAWEAQNQRAMVGVHFYNQAVQLGDRKDVSALIRTAKRGGYEFIVLDTQARCTVGLEENSASEMGVVVAALDVLKSVTGACVALVHHSGASGGRARGSTAILGALDAEFEVEADKDAMTVTMHTKAQKDLAEAPEVEFDLVTPGVDHSLAVKPRIRGQWYQARPEDLAPLDANEMELLRAVDTFGFAGGTVSDLAKVLGDDHTEIKQRLSGIHRKGIVRSKGNSWSVDRVGRVHLSGTLDSVRED
ncbi:AAA family ATPase [Streptomyces sp. NPDC002754]